MRRCCPTVLCLFFIGCTVCQAEEITLTPAQDTTIFEELTGSSNGSGIYLFSGATASRNGGAVRRALLSFDLSTIPAGSMITEVSFEMNVNKVPSRAVTSDMNLHRLTAAFGEGSSDAGGNEGRGTAAADGDATWDSSIVGTSDWEQAGGDFVEETSATAVVGGRGPVTWESTEQLVADVQLWIDSPELNFGWILIGDEGTPRSAKRFDSVQGRNSALHPSLNVVFESNSVAGDYDADGALGVTDIDLLCGAISGGSHPADFDLTGDGFVDAGDLGTWLSDLANSFVGDSDIDGDVDFDDFVNLSGGFGQAGTWSNGDFDCNATVNFDDFVALSTNFGQSSAGQAAMASVPEPNTFSLLAVGILCVTFRRARTSTTT